MMYSEQLRPKNLDITVRKVNYNYYQPIKNNRYWANNDPVLTHFFNAFQATFPEGEKLFIQAALDGRTMLRRKGTLDPQFASDIKKFMRQEALHSQQHKKWTTALIEYGYPGIRDFNAMLRQFRVFARKYLPTSFRLAITAAAEHYTASLAYLFTHIRPDILMHMPVEFRGLLLYHAMEEIEHKSVCFDLYQNVSGSYLLRIFGFFFITVDFIANVYLRMRYMLKRDGLLNHRFQFKLTKFMFGTKGIVKSLLFQIKRYV